MKTIIKPASEYLSLLLISLIILHSSCSKHQEAAESSPSVTASTTDAVSENIETTTAGGMSKTEITAGNKIIRNASVRFQVADHQHSFYEIQNLLKNYEAYLTSSHDSRSDDKLETTMVIRVPVHNLENLLRKLTEQSLYLDYKNISSEDVTAEFVDISARLKTKQAVEQRYVALLKQAKNLKEVFEVENQLRLIREEIEGTQARINYIRDQAAYSTITLQIYQNNAGNAAGRNFLVRVGNALHYGWDLLLSLIIGLLYIWPVWLLLLLAFYGLRILMRKYPPIR